jgi:hypothetical protein
MQKSTVATILVVSALIVYALLRFLLPAFQTERLVFLAFLTVAGLILMMMHRREKNKPAS